MLGHPPGNGKPAAVIRYLKGRVDHHPGVGPGREGRPLIEGIDHGHRNVQERLSTEASRDQGS